MKPVSPRSPGLDTLRSLAIASVVFFHINAYHHGTLPERLVPAARLGWMGVDLFFVLSGYLIGSQLLRPYRDARPAPLREFYRNRLYRILPAYIVVLALYFLVPGFSEDPALAPLWQYATFTFNLFVDYARYGGFSHCWSLCVEEHFYLLLPVIVLLMMRKPSARKTMGLIAGFVLLGMAVRAWMMLHVLRPADATGDGFGLLYIERIYYPTYSHFEGLLAGVGIALVKLFRPVWWTQIVRHGHGLLLGGAALIAAAIYLTRDRFASLTGASAAGVVIGYPVLSLGLALVVMCALSGNGVLRFRVPGAQTVATLAYSIYLTHKALMHLVDRAFPWAQHGGGAAWLGVYSACCLAAAAVLYLGVERPFLRLRDRGRVEARVIAMEEAG